MALKHHPVHFLLLRIKIFIIRKRPKKCLLKYLKPIQFFRIQIRGEIMIILLSLLVIKTIKVIKKTLIIMVLDIHGKIQNLILILITSKMHPIFIKMEARTCFSHLKTSNHHLNFLLSNMSFLTNLLVILLFRWPNKFLAKYLVKWSKTFLSKLFFNSVNDLSLILEKTLITQ
jgi:hypothetical protein